MGQVFDFLGIKTKANATGLQQRAQQLQQLPKKKTNSSIGKLPAEGAKLP
jgi:hypothetical protein